MTSELGCITPWIMVPGKYSLAELKNQAECVVAGIHNNASANCLAPKVVILDEHWPQREEFIQMIKESWRILELPVPFYPGAAQRWKRYREEYPQAQEWDSKTGHGVKERQLSPPLLNYKQGEGALLLPLLCIDIDVDMSSQQGLVQVKKEYAFKHEPFCPVVTFATVKAGPSNGEDYLKVFMKQVTALCNDYIHGSLSCSMTVPEYLEGTPAVESSIADLKYGTIGVNLWTVLCYTQSWGGHPQKECLDCVESGIGRVQNLLFIPHLQKSVVRMSLIDKNHPKVNPDHGQARREVTALGKFVLKPGFLSFVSMMTSLVPIPVAKAVGVIGATATVAIAAIVLNKKGV